LTQRWELENLLCVAMIIAQGAQQRRESRGGHARVDFPDRKDELNFHTLATMPDYGRIRFEKRDVDMSLFKARGEHFEKFGVIERRY